MIYNAKNMVVVAMHSLGAKRLALARELGQLPTVSLLHAIDVQAKQERRHCTRKLAHQASSEARDSVTVSVIPV